MKRTLPLLVGVLVFGVGAFVFVRARLALSAQVQVARVDVSLQSPAEALVSERISLTLIDRDGLERTVYQDLELPSTTNQRYRKILQALKAAMQEAGVWVDGVSVQEVFLVERPESRLAVVDFAVTDEAAASVREERAMLDAMRETLARNNIDGVRVFVNGDVPETFLGHVAVASSLER